MKKIYGLVLFSITTISYAGQVAQAADQEAMQDCLKTKTQAECNIVNKAAKKTTKDIKTKESQ